MNTTTQLTRYRGGVGHRHRLGGRRSGVGRNGLPSLLFPFVNVCFLSCRATRFLSTCAAMAHLDRGPRFQGEGCYGSIPVFFTWAAAAGVTRLEADASENTEIVSALVRVYPGHICPTGSTPAAIHFFQKKNTIQRRRRAGNGPRRSSRRLHSAPCAASHGSSSWPVPRPSWQHHGSR